MKVELSGKSSGGGSGASSKIYSCLVSQSGTSIPTQIILENTIGLTLTWSYVGVGNYKATSDIVFDLTKTFIYSSKTTNTMEHNIGVRTQNTTQFYLGIEAIGGGGVNNEINKMLVNILVYD